MKQIRIFSFVASLVLCVLLLTAGCTEQAGESAQTKIEPQNTTPARVESEEKKPIVLALKFTPADSTTYKVTTDADNSVIWESTDPDKPKGKYRSG